MTFADGIGEKIARVTVYECPCGHTMRIGVTTRFDGAEDIHDIDKTTLKDSQEVFDVAWKKLGDIVGRRLAERWIRKTAHAEHLPPPHK